MKHLQAAFGRRNDAGMYLAVLILGIVGWLVLGSIPLVVVIFGQHLFATDSSELEQILQQIMSPNGFITLMFSSFVIGLIVLVLLVRLMHRRGFSSVVNGRDKVRWSHFFTAFALYFICMALIHLVMMLVDRDNFVFQFDAEAFFSMLPLLLVLVPLQTLFEEYLFRGYLMQAVTVWSRRLWIVWIVPAVVFALAHAANPEVGAYGFSMMMLQYLLLALIFGYFTLSDDGLEVSWGMHTANNLFLLLFFTEENSAMPTPAVWRITDASPSFADPLEILLLGVVLWFVLRRLYRWKRPALGCKIDITDVEK